MEFISIKKLLDILRDTSDVLVEFIKKDGSKRLMKSTLNYNNIPEEKYPTKKESKDIDNIENQPDPFIRVFDTEKGEWRGFKYNTITSVKTKDGKVYTTKQDKTSLT